MNIQRKRERILHYLTAALPSVGVFTFDVLIKRLNTWLFIAALLVLYAITFGLIIALDEFVEAICKHIPIRLPGVGKIDGWWVDAIHGRAREILAGATIFIQSSGNGFDIWGKIFVVDEKLMTLSPIGQFHGQGFALLGSNTLVYCFEGDVLGKGEKGNGRIDYSVPNPRAKDSVRMEGSFIGISNVGIKNGKPGYRFVGEKVLGNTEDAAQQILLAKLQAGVKKPNTRETRDQRADSNASSGSAKGLQKID